MIAAVAGELVAITSRLSISAARQEVERIRDDYYDYVKDKSTSLTICKSVTGEFTQHLYGHLFGHFSARLIPWVFICIWFPLVGVSYYAFDYAIHCVSCASSQAEKPPAHR